MEYKGYRINPINNMMGYELQHIGRGSIHKSLQGFFTSVKIAKEHIDDYLKGKEEVDAETNATSRDKQVHRRAIHRRKSSNDPR